MKHVVLIDTDSQLLRDISDLLRARYDNLEIDYAFDGKSGYDLIQRKRPQIIITDLILPELDGWSLLRQIHATLSPMPYCIVYTDMDTPFLRNQLKQIGVHAFFNKGFPPSVVIHAIQAYFPVSSAKVEQTIAQVLNELGFAVKNKGYYYVVEAVKICFQNPDALHHIVEQIYTYLAKKDGKSEFTSAKAIRHSIEMAFAVDHPKWIQLFGNRDRKPTNSEFLGIISEHVRQMMISADRL